MSSRVLTVEGYVRRPGSTSLSAQVSSIVLKSAAAKRGWRLARIIQEKGGSDRLEEALRRVESGEIDGLVVAQLLDLGRSLREVVAAIERIRAAGGTLLSVTDGIELGPDTGTSTWRLLVSLAEWS